MRLFIDISGIHINSIVLDRLEGDWDADEEEEFKTLFLMVALQMVLCPTQSPRLAADLVPALTCARECAKYDWCGLLLNKLMDSVLNFACRFYGTGFASGCGGCTMFLVLFYLDRLNRDPVEWGIFPRVKVWDMKQIKTATKEDRISCTGEYGKLGMLDVVYGEQHPLAARDTNGPTHQTEVGFAIENPHDCKLKKKRRGATSNKSPHDRKAEKALISPKLGSSNCPLPVMDCLFVRLLFFLRFWIPIQIHPSCRNLFRARCTALFISLRSAVIFVLESGMPSMGFTGVNRLLMNIRNLLGERSLSFFAKLTGWSITILNNNPVRVSENPSDAKTSLNLKN